MSFSSRTRRPQRAFTLVEILVVIVIVGIMISVTVLSINVLGRDSQLSDETKRLEALFGLVREQAELQNRDYGLRLEETGYLFMRFDVRRNEWMPVPGDDLMKRRSFPPGLRARLYVDAREVQLKPPSDKKAQWPPQVMVLSSGDLTGFELKLQREGSDLEATLLGKVDGTMERKEPKDDRL